MMISHPHLTSTPLPQLDEGPPPPALRRSLIGCPGKVHKPTSAFDWFRERKNNVAAIDPQMVNCERQTAGNKEEMPYTDGNVQDVQIFP